MMTTASGKPFHSYTPVHLDTEYLAQKLNDRWHERNPGHWQGSSASWKAELLDSFRDSVRSLEAALATGSPEIFTDYACWLKVIATHRRFPPDFIMTFLAVSDEVLRAELPPDFRDEARVILRKSRAAAKKAPGTVPSFLRKQNPLSSQSEAFLSSLLRGDRTESEQIIAAAVSSGIPLQDIYLKIIQPALAETGRLWQIREIPVGTEHFISAATIAVMARLHDRIRLMAEESGRRDATVIAAAIGGDLHDIGIRILADFFEMDGWDTYLTGANTPPESILAMARERNADVIAISCTMASHIALVEYLIRSLHSDPATKDIRILAGGYPFIIAPGLWQQVGADAFARDAAEAVAAADRLMAERENIS